MDASTSAPTFLSRSGGALDSLSPPNLAALIAATSDLAVVLDRDGVVQELAVSDTDLPPEVYEGWVGRPFMDSVTAESREKVERLLQVGNDGDPIVAQAHINHPRLNGLDLPVRYSCAPLGSERVVALGRDLSPVANAQRRLLAAQRQADQDYQTLRRAEGRFREYFQLMREPSLFLDTEDRISAVNQAAQTNWQKVPKLVGRRVTDLAKGADRDGLAQVVAQARQAQAARTGVLKIGRVIVSPVRYERGYLLVRFCDSGVGPATPSEKLARVVEAMPDGFVVTDAQFSILAANHAFANMTEAGGNERLEGSSLDRWLGRPGVDLSVIRSALSETGTLRGFATVVKGELGHLQEVEVSAVKVKDVHGDYVGLSVRQAVPAESMLPTRSAQQLADLVGRVPMKEIVRETTDTIERMCIEAALELSGDNRASAAELLGLSRQSLYVKMRRFGIVDVDGDGGPEG